MDFKELLTLKRRGSWNINEVDEAIKAKLPSLLTLIEINKITKELERLMPKYLKSTKNCANDQEKIEFILTHMTDNEMTVYKFIHILLHTGQDAAAYRLALIFSIEITHLIDPSKYNQQIDPKDRIGDCPYRTTDSMSNAYRMDSNIRGFCFLVNNYFTVGTHNEMHRFRNIFSQLGFKVIMKKNLAAKDVYLNLLSISKSPELSNHNAFIFMNISHGTENGEIIGFDEKPMRIDLLTELFNNKECINMINKPRIFFFNCCRGGDIDEGTTTLAKPSTQWMKPNIPTISDFLICYSTLQGYKAKVDWNEGTCFGKYLSESFIEKAKYKDLDAILKAANDKTEKNYDLQVFDWTQSMKRQVYFYEKDWKREENIRK